MDSIERHGRLKQRISELEAGKEIDAKHINVLLSKERQQQFAAEWRQQQKLRKAKKPAALNAYEALHKQASALLARCWSSASRTKAEQATLIKLQTKCVAAIERAHAEITKQIKKRATLAEWLDRAVADIDEIVLDTANQKAVKHNNTVLNDCYERLPILVTSKNERRRVTQEERFGWQTKRDIRLRLLRDTLNELNDNLLAELEKEQERKTIKAARIFLDAYFKAVDEQKNPWAEANAALQRNGFRREDQRWGRGFTKRDIEVREMEEALLKRFEAEMTEEEREQLSMSKEYDKQAERAGK